MLERIHGVVRLLRLFQMSSTEGVRASGIRTVIKQTFPMVRLIHGSSLTAATAADRRTPARDHRKLLSALTKGFLFSAGARRHLLYPTESL